MKIIDTNIVSDHMFGKPEVVKFINSSKPEDLYVTTITILESLQGWEAALRKTSDIDRIAQIHLRISLTMQVLAQFQIAPYSQNAISIFENLKRQKLNVSSNDLKIAAIAIANGASLVTQNTRDFERISGLTLESWQDD